MDIYWELGQPQLRWQHKLLFLEQRPQGTYPWPLIQKHTQLWQFWTDPRPLYWCMPIKSPLITVILWLGCYVSAPFVPLWSKAWEFVHHRMDCLTNLEVEVCTFADLGIHRGVNGGLCCEPRVKLAYIICTPLPGRERETDIQDLHAHTHTHTQ